MKGRGGALGFIRLECRVEQEETGYEISILIDPDHYGKKIAERALNHMHTMKKDAIFWAEILPENSRSLMLFEKLGYKLVSEGVHRRA